VLEDIARTGEREQLPLVDAEVGALLRILAAAVGATRILEIGTAIGYSGIWLAGALPPGGMLITMEMDEARARVARENFARAGLADRASVVVGDAKLKIAHFDLGIVYSDQGFDDKAAGEFGETIRVAPNDYGAHYRLARLYQKMGKRAEAAAEFAIVQKLHEHEDDESLINVK